MNRLLFFALSLFLASCTSSARRPVPKPTTPRPVPVSLGTLTLALGTATVLEPTEAGQLLYVAHTGLWALSGPERPVVAVLGADSKSELWMLHRRHGAQIGNNARVTNRPHPGTYRRAAVTRGELRSGTFLGHLPKDILPDDRYVLIADGQGPISGRIVGLLDTSEAQRQVTLRPETSAQKVTAVRVGSVSEEVHGAPLGVRVDDSCETSVGEKLQTSLERLDTGKIEFDSAGVHVACGDGTFHVKSARRLLRTPFWAPHELSVPTLADVTAILAGVHGELDRALFALQPGGSTHVRAALSLEAGWLLDTTAIMVGSNHPQDALLAAGALYLLGDYPTALTALDGTSWDGAVGEAAWRAPLARAVIQLKSGDPKGAIKQLHETIQNEGDVTTRRSLLLGLAELYLATGDLPHFVSTIQLVGSLKGPQTPAQAALRSRYAGLILQSGGRTDDALAAYLEAAAAYEAAGDLRQAAQALLRVAQLKVALQRSADAELAEAKRLAIAGHGDDVLSRVALDSLTLFAEVHAAEDAPEGGNDRLGEAVRANLRADRLDRVAVAHRYGLLLLPSNADISAKRRAVADALQAALAAPDLEEITILLSLLAKLQAAGFQFDDANRNIDLAIEFAVEMGDDELLQLLREEKTTFQ